MPTQIRRAADLVTQASLGDAVAIDELLVRNLPRLRAYVKFRCRRPVRESHSDLVQSVCREVLEGMENFEYRGEAAFRHWLITNAVNKIRDRHDFHNARKRDVRREQELPVEDGEAVELAPFDWITASQVAMGREDVARFERAYFELDESDQEIIALKRIIGLTHSEIAEALGITAGAARMKLSRALNGLAIKMARTG